MPCKERNDGATKIGCIIDDGRSSTTTVDISVGMCVRQDVAKRYLLSIKTGCVGGAVSLRTYVQSILQLDANCEYYNFKTHIITEYSFHSVAERTETTFPPHHKGCELCQ